jgi:hypothetical protein
MELAVVMAVLVPVKVDDAVLVAAAPPSGQPRPGMSETC